MEYKNMKLSQRLIHVASFLPKGAVFADIGSDHAYLPCYVCLKDETATAIAGEVNVGPYESAKNNVRKSGLHNRIDVRLGNGLEVLNEDEIEQIVIAGMGGALIVDILEEGHLKLENVKRIIAQPNIDARKVRVWLHEHNFNISAEQILDEKGHVYEILVADRDAETPYNDELIAKQFLFGPFLLEKKSTAFHKKWYYEKENLNAIINQMKRASKLDIPKIKQFSKELTWIEEELANEEDSN